MVRIEIGAGAVITALGALGFFADPTWAWLLLAFGLLLILHGGMTAMKLRFQWPFYRQAQAGVNPAVVQDSSVGSGRLSPDEFERWGNVFLGWLTKVYDAKMVGLKDNLPRGGISAITLPGGNTTEATTTSTSAVDLLGNPALSIPPETAFIVACYFGLSAGLPQISSGDIGLKLNGRDVYGGRSIRRIQSSESGVAIWYVGRDKAAIQGVTLFMPNESATKPVGVVGSRPMGVITYVSVYGLTNGAVLAVDRLSVYTLPD